MSVIGAEYSAEATRIVDDRIVRLRQLTYDQALALPDTTGEEIVVAGTKATLTVFRQDSPHQLEGQTLVTVLIARERWFGMAAHHIEKGLVFSPGRTPREATELELQNSGG